MTEDPDECDLVLTGEDARRFHEYMEHPTIPESGRKLIGEAVRQVLDECDEND